jgi:hypothetical protein
MRREGKGTMEQGSKKQGQSSKLNFTIIQKVRPIDDFFNLPFTHF